MAALFYLLILLSWVALVFYKLFTMPKSPEKEEQFDLDKFIDNVHSLESRREKVELEKAANLLFQSEQLEKISKYANYDDVQSMELKLRFERRKVLNSLQKKGLINQDI